MPDLPTELHEAIIDATFAEGLQLRSCSLVSKSWLRRSRYNFFGYLDLRNQSSSRIFSLVMLLESPHITIAPFIRRIDLDCFEDWEGRGLYYVLPALSALPHVKAVVFYDTVSHPRTCGAMATFLGGFSRLTSLLFENCIFANRATLSTTLAGCSQLEHLKFERTKIPFSDSRGEVSNSMSAHCPHIQSLRVVGCPADCAPLEWLLSGSVPQDFRTVRLLDIEEPATRSITRDLQSLVDLKVLDVGFQNRNFDAAQSQDTFCRKFICNPQLQVFSVHSLRVNSRQGSCVPRLLAKLTAPSIRTVIVGLRMRDVDDLDKLEWGGVDAILQRPNYARLHAFIIGFEDHVFGVGATGWMKETFPLAFARGIAKVVRLDEDGNIDFQM